MALLTNAGQSYLLSGANGVGLHNREDLADFITNISPPRPRSRRLSAKPVPKLSSMSG